MGRNKKIVEPIDVNTSIDENSIPTEVTETPTTIDVEVKALVEIKSILETLPIKYAQSITPIVMYIDTLLTNK